MSGPALNFDPQLLLAAQGIHIAFFDVDGVLTDGSIYLTDAGETIKRFHTLDGHGIKLLQRTGIVPAVVTSRDCAPLRLRLKAPGVTHARFGTEDKRPAAEAILAGLGLDWSQAAAFAAAPPHAQAEVLAAARYVTQAHGGQGAAREFCDLLLVARGHYARLLEEARG
ncbi:KdsC family phosphatase [Xylophilus sp.]|uniref:KdsC family phosphatase n=1 Tax=Xylophilus sp. TaxID=2653893 RepID=UPI0013BE6C50|nr:3-deoxy-D-manno-octulosonate 8-phosphate phosphatase [Xylophilus sp.]KAF1045909.1 MAG: 3-deoxy-D-manno-octulosonate 8-phosphate phosphatase KdsC [Xylophilus sp.]